MQIAERPEFSGDRDDFLDAIEGTDRSSSSRGESPFGRRLHGAWPRQMIAELVVAQAAAESIEFD